MTYIIYKDLYFSTHTIHEWQNILLIKNIPEIIFNAFQYLTKNEQINIYAYVIMPNHFHWIYQIKDPYSNSKIKHTLLSFTAKEILSQLGALKEYFLVNKENKKYQVWKSPSLSVEIQGNKFFNQKFNYIHLNPIRAGLVSAEENYIYSSWRHYLRPESKPEFLTLW